MVEFSPEARSDLADIRRYTFDKLGVKQVDVYVNKPAGGIQRIRVMPGIGRWHDEIPDGLLLVKKEQHYLVYQHVDDRIYIVRILFTLSNLGRHFEEYGKVCCPKTCTDIGITTARQLANDMQSMALLLR